MRGSSRGFRAPPFVTELLPGQSATFNPSQANEAAFVEAVRQAPSIGTYALTVDPGVILR